MNFLDVLDLPLIFHLTIGLSALGYVYYCWRTKVPIVPTLPSARDVVVAEALIEIGRRSNECLKVYDLGSGMGGLCLEIARAAPDAEVRGIEIALPAWCIAVLRQKFFNLKNLNFLRGDFWDYDISDGDIILCYLGVIIMPRLGEKLLHEPRADRLIISNTFPLPAPWRPWRCIPIPAILGKEILLYRQKA